MLSSKIRNRHTVVREALFLKGERLGARVARGAWFTLLSVFVRVVITVGSISVLARLLQPSDFGLISMATIVTEFAMLFSNFGFAAVLIQKKRISRLQMDTVFWASLALGVFICITVFVFSFVASWFFNEVIAGDILRVLCLIFILNALTVVHGALISRLMYFNLDFWIDLASRILGAITSILFAWFGAGVWSLVAGSLCTVIIRTLMMVCMVPYLPRLKISIAYIKSTWKTNTSYFAGGFLFFANSNLDLLLIGRMLGVTALGYYQNARSLTDEVRNRLAAPLQRVFFPAFSALQDDLSALQHSVLRSGRLLAAIIFPLGIGIAATADELILLLYGAKWLAMIPIVKFLAIRISVAGSCSIATSLFNSQNRVDLALRYSVIGSVLYIVSISVSAAWGMVYVAAACALSSLYNLFCYGIALRLISLSWRDLCSIIIPPLCASLLMWGSIEFFRVILEQYSLILMGKLTLFILLGVLVYVLSLLCMSRPILLDFKMLMKRSVKA